jgi:hypothetical protein
LLMLIILSRHVVFIAPNHIFNYLDFQTLTLNISDEGYSQRSVGMSNDEYFSNLQLLY